MMPSYRVALILMRNIRIELSMNRAFIIASDCPNLVTLMKYTLYSALYHVTLRSFR